MARFLIFLLAAQCTLASIETIDSECRIQAKETAINTYQTCVKESRSQKIEEIRKEYQSKLQELKSYYDGEMKKMSTSNKASEEKSTSEVVLKKKNKVSSSKGQTGLPSKKIQGKTLPVRNLETETKPDVTTSLDDGNDAHEIVTSEENAI